MAVVKNVEESVLYLLEDILHNYYVKRLCIIYLIMMKMSQTKPRKRTRIVLPYSILGRLPTQMNHMNRLAGVTDTDCIINLRMDRNAFGRLCRLCRDQGSLRDTRFMCVEEQVAIFLGILAHHKKNRVVGFDFWRSGHTVSTYVHEVLRAILNMHTLFMVQAVPVPEDCTDTRWKWFKGCLGALDGTHINVMVGNADKPRYRTRKGQIATNTLAACDRNMRFTYVLPGWEGSAGDARVLRDAVNRRHGLRVPVGKYYLCDNGYANSEGFLTPYKGVRYHLKEWGPANEIPRDPHEMFNMRHTKARNIIERAFAVLKMRWGILRSASFYPIKVQIRLILACFLLHNFIRSEMAIDPIEQQLDDEVDGDIPVEEQADTDFVNTVEATNAWQLQRDELALAMWNHEQLAQ